MPDLHLPETATPAERWIVLAVMVTGGVKPAVKASGRSLRRVQQVVAKYNIDPVNHRCAISFTCNISQQ